MSKPSSSAPEGASLYRTAAARAEEARVVHLSAPPWRGVVLFLACVGTGAILGFGADQLLHADSVAAMLEIAGVAAGFFMAFRRSGGRELVLRESGVVLRRGDRVIADVPWSTVGWRPGYSSMTGRGGTYHYPTHELTLGTTKLIVTGLANYSGARSVKLPMGVTIAAEDEPLLREFLAQYVAP